MMETEIAAPSSEQLLTADEVATLLQVTTPWVYAQTRAGTIPHIALGRYKRYRRSAIEDWLVRIEQLPPPVGRWSRLEEGNLPRLRIDPVMRSSPHRAATR